MNLDSFTPIKNSGKTWGEIFDTYDKQFNQLRDYLLSLSEKYSIETFTNTTNRVITLTGSYSKGQIIVYINNVIQWKDVDYQETSGNVITLLKDITPDDVVRVFIFQKTEFSITDNITTALKAVADENGNNIAETYLTRDAMKGLITVEKKIVNKVDMIGIDASDAMYNLYKYRVEYPFPAMSENTYVDCSILQSQYTGEYGIESSLGKYTLYFEDNRVLQDPITVNVVVLS